MHTGINRRQVHPLIRFLLRSRVDERVDLTKPFIICLEAVLVGVMVRTAVSLSAAIPLGTSTKRADFLKEQKSRSVRVFLKTPFRPCLLGVLVLLCSWMVYAFVLSV